jgi:hypothetical protein
VTTPQPKPGTGGQRGARPVGGPDDGARTKPWWLLALLAVIAVIALVLLLSRCGSSSDTAATSPASSTTSAAATTSAASSSSAATTSAASASTGAATTGAASTSAPAAGAAGAGAAGSSPLTANGTALLPLATAAPGGTLTAFVGQDATSKGVTVQSVPDVEDGLWVGTSPTDRVWVTLIDDAEPPYTIALGDKVNFVGKVVANPPSFAASAGLSAADGAAQLDTQAAHIEVAETGVTLAT